jgi:hypothetical protein
MYMYVRINYLFSYELFIINEHNLLLIEKKKKNNKVKFYNE